MSASGLRAVMHGLSRFGRTTAFRMSILQIAIFLVTALLDEVIGRVAIAHNLWAVTAKLEVRFRRPVPLGQPLTLVGEITRLRSRTLEGRGEIRLEDGTVAAEAEGVYIRLPQEEIERVEEELDFWKVVPD